MSISPVGSRTTDPAVTVQQAKGPAAAETTEATKAPTAYGSTPAAVVDISAQAKAVQAKADAIKHGHDPDGLQDGK